MAPSNRREHHINLQGTALQAVPDVPAVLSSCPHVPAGVHQCTPVYVLPLQDRKERVMYAYDSYKKNYLMGADGQYYEVSEEIWNEYMRSVWREEAARRREGGPANGKNKKKGSPTDSSNYLPKVVSYESLTDARGDAFLPSHRSVEEEVVEKSIRVDIHDRLHRALDELGPEEKFLIGKLYLEGDGMTIREYAERYGRPRTTMQYQRKRIMEKLRAVMEAEDGFSLDIIYAICEHHER